MGTQSEFFRQRDSVQKAQYSHGDQDIYNSVDINSKMLQQFLTDIDVNQLQKTGTFEKSYFFNIAPPQYKDTKECKDIIRVQYLSSSCTFILIIDNVYMVQDLGCAGGTQVIYSFKISNGHVRDFGRNEAG
jgi:hypothetical protein